MTDSVDRLRTNINEFIDNLIEGYNREDRKPFTGVAYSPREVLLLVKKRINEIKC